MIWRSTVVQNAFALFGLQIFRKVSPLVIIPYLTRTLGVTVWGRVAFAMALGSLIALLVEFGFHLSATRSIARTRASISDCSHVVAGVMGVQLALFSIGALTALFVLPWLPYLRSDVNLFGACLLFAAAQGFMPIWFFQGMERIRAAVVLEVVGRLIAVGCVFLFVHSPEDGVTSVLMQAFAPGVLTAVGLSIMYATVPFRFPSKSSLSAALSAGFPLFIFRGSKALYGPANVVLLGLFAPLSAVSYFAAAEKIYTAAYGLLTPLQDALYPRISQLLQRSIESAARLAKLGAIAVLSWAVILAAGLFLTAEPIIRLVMGPGFENAVTPLRILACVLPSAAVMVSIAMQWLVPLGMEGAVTRGVFIAGIVNIVLAVILVPRFAHIGMALSVAIAETVVAISMVFVASKATPFWRVQRTPQTPEALPETSSTTCI